MWMGYIDNEKDPQGLLESPLIKWHRHKIDEWTEREHKIADIVISMLGKYYEKVICLQECSKEMLELIKKKIREAFRERFKVLNSEVKYNDLGVVIYDQTKLLVSDSKVVHGIYSDDRDHFIMDVRLNSQISSMQFRLVNAHIPGGMRSKGKEQLATYLKTHFDSGLTTVVVGDMNKSSELVKQAIVKSFKGESPFQLIPSTYSTYVNSKREPADFDQIYLYTKESSAKVLPFCYPALMKAPMRQWRKSDSRNNIPEVFQN